MSTHGPSSTTSVQRISRSAYRRSLSSTRRRKLSKRKHQRRKHHRIEPSPPLTDGLQSDPSISRVISDDTGPDPWIGSSPSSRCSTYIDTADLRRTLFKRKRKRRRFFWFCPWPCYLLCCTLLLLLLAIGLAALFIHLSNKRTTTAATETTTSVSSTSTTSTATTTTTRRNCGSSCVNQTWISSSNLLAKWLLDGSFDDSTSVRNASGVNNPSFLVGYVNQAVYLDATANQSIAAPHLPLSNSSFTITLWIRVAGYLNPTFHSLLGVCAATVPNQCLHIAIRNDLVGHNLYMDFFGNRCQGTSNILVNTWYHISFVFDAATLTQLIYVNGILDQSCSAVSPLMLISTTVTTIGSVPLLVPLNGSNFYHGLLDQLVVNQRVKGACELFEEASLVTRFEFDGPSINTDSGPNNLYGSGSEFTLVPAGRSPQAISFAGTNTSHFKIEHISVLGIANHSFSILYWIQPKNLSGSILHLSSSADGRGWCMPYMGFMSNGAIFAEILSGGIKVVASPNQLPTDAWSHIAQTWSSTNGLRLYVNGTVVASDPSLTWKEASGVPMYASLGSGVIGLFHCTTGALPSNLPFPGSIDDFRVYNRELNTIDICTVFYAD